MYSRVYVEITNICNKSCSFCHGHSREPMMMSREQFCRLLGALEGITEYVYYHLMGEPLVHPLLPELIGEAGRRGFKSVVTTNGVCLEQKGAALIAAGVYKVNISVHSFEGECDEDFYRYVHGCLDFADRASRLGVLVILRLWNNGCDGGRNAEILRLLRERFCDGEWVSAPNGARIKHRLHLEYGERFEWPDMAAADGGNNVFCHALSDHFGILCDGTVVPCCLDSDGKLALGNAFDTPISQLLSSDRARRIREGFRARCAAEELCRKCGYARRFK